MESIGFKEWALVCEALGRGAQSLILRKGGIAEGGNGFAFRHAEFFLFPTFFHGQLGLVRSCGPEVPHVEPGRIEIKFFAKVEETRMISDLQRALRLEPLHVLSASVVKERFEYDNAPGIYVAFVRVFRLRPTWDFNDEARYRGCRSWVNLPTRMPEVSLEPVLDDAEHTRRWEKFKEMLAKGSPRPYPSLTALRQGFDVEL
jgi:hypothetical protein